VPELYGAFGRQHPIDYDYNRADVALRHGNSAVSGVAQQASAPSFGVSQISNKSEAAGLQNQNTQEEPSSPQVANPADQPAALHSAANGRIRVATSLLALVIALSGLIASTA
jgi:hypothetical protein